MNKIDVTLKSGWNGIGKCACKLFASLGMIEDREIGLQQTIRLTDRDRKLIQSPAGEIVFDVMPFDVSHSWTTEVVSGAGAVNDPIYQGNRRQK